MQQGIKGQEKHWLIRSSLRILGPFTLSEVTQLLAARQISIIDEVRVPDKRWTYIRENPIFMELVETLRAQQDTAVETTMAGQTTTTGSTQKLGVTKTDWIQGNDDLTPTPLHQSPEPMIRDITPLSEQVTTGPQPSGDTKVRSYGFENDFRLQAKKRKFQRQARLAFALLLSALVVMVVMREVWQDNREQKSIDQAEIRAHLDFTQGFEKAALEGYQRVINNRPLKNSYQFDFGLLQIRSGDTLGGRRYLEELLNQNKSREEQSRIINALGISHLIDGDIAKAEDMFLRAATLERSFLAPRLNLLQIRIQRGQYSGGLNSAKSLIEQWPDDLSLRLLQAQFALEGASSGGAGSEEAMKISQELGALIGKRHYLSQPLSIIRLSLNRKFGSESDIQSAFAQYMNSLPLQAANFYDSFEVSSLITAKSVLSKYCSSQFSDQSDLSWELIVKASCLLELGRDSEASRLVEDVLSKSPTDKWGNLLRSSILVYRGRGAEALANLKSMGGELNAMSGYLKLISCDKENNIQCLEEGVNEVLRLQPSDSFALYHRAKLELSRGLRDQAWSTLTYALKTEPNFIPLISLRNQLERGEP